MLTLRASSFSGSLALGSQSLLTGSIYGVHLGAGSGVLLRRALEPATTASRVTLRALSVGSNASTFAQSLLTGSTYGAFSGSGTLRRLSAAYLRADGDQTISFVGVASTAAFGVPVFAGPITFVGVAPTAAFGTPTIFNLEQTITFSGIASTAAVGVPEFQHVINFSGIAPTVAFGTPTFSQEITFRGVASTAAFGVPVFVEETDRVYTVFIAGVNRTRWVKSASGGPGVSCQKELSGSRASFRIIPKDGVTYTPTVGDEVVIHHNETGYRMFAGEVDSMRHRVETGSSGYYELDVTCIDYGVMLMRRAMARWYTVALGSYVPIILRDIVDRFLVGTGITYDGIVPPTGLYIGEQLCNWRYVGEFLRTICDAAGLDFHVDQYKVLRLIDPTLGYGPAPVAIEQNNGLWRQLTCETTRTSFANRVIVRNSADVTALWTDTVELNGALIYQTTYPQSVRPVVLVDGERVTVVPQSELGSVDAAFYYLPDGMGIFATTSAPASGTMEIKYPSRVSYVAIAEDADSIAADGLWEHIEEVTDLTDPDTLQAAADSILARRNVVPRVVTIESDELGFEPGQLLTVDANGVEGEFLIESVDVQEVAHAYPRTTIVAANPSQRNGSATDRALRLQMSSRQPVDRVDSGVAFGVAESIEGFENEGLTVGVKNAIRVARKGGWLKTVRLMWRSIDAEDPDTWPTSDVRIDILQNGVSIFPTGEYMLYPAGASTTVEQFWFREDPLPVEAGDLFTIEVVSADAILMDGFLELQVQG